MGVTIVVTFIFTFIFRKVSVLNKLEPELALADTGVTDTATTVDPMTSSANAATTVTEEMLYAPADGQIIAIGEVEDPVFHKNDG